MSIQSEMERITQNISNTYSALEEQGATMPAEQNSDNLAATARSVPAGGGGTVSWNDLTDKPFYKTTTVQEILPETKVESRVIDEEITEYFIPGEPGSISFVVGGHYTVTYNGVEYQATGNDFDGMVGLVNDGADLETGEGCVFGVLVTSEDVAEVFPFALGVEALDGSTPETLAIRGEVTEVKQIDEEFVPKETVIRIKLVDAESQFTCDEYTPAEIVEILHKDPATRVVYENHCLLDNAVMCIVAQMVVLNHNDHSVAADFQAANVTLTLVITPDGISGQI